MKHLKRSMFRVLVLSLLAAWGLPLAAAAAGPLQQVPDPTALSDPEIQQLATAARGMRVGLAELRTLAPRPENQARRRELRLSIEADFQTFLDVAHLSRADFVRLLDSENGIDLPGRETNERVELRPLAPREP